MFVGPLSMAALRQVIIERLGTAIPRPVLARIADASGGNPFYAVEIARGVSGDASTGQPLPVPRGMSKLAMERISLLSACGAGGGPSGCVAVASDNRDSAQRADRASREC